MEEVPADVTAEVPSDSERLLAQARRHCRRLIDELERYRREVDSNPGPLAPESVAQGRVCIDAAATAARRVFDGLA